MPISSTLADLAASLSAIRSRRATRNATPRGPSRQDRFLDALRADVTAQGLQGVALPLLSVERLWCEQHDPATPNAKTPWRSLDAGLRTDAVAHNLPADVAIISAEEMKAHGLMARACIVLGDASTPAASLVASAIQSLVEAHHAAVVARERLTGGAA